MLVIRGNTKVLITPQRLSSITACDVTSHCANRSRGLVIVDDRQMNSFGKLTEKDERPKLEYGKLPISSGK